MRVGAEQIKKCILPAIKLSAISKGLIAFHILVDAPYLVAYKLTAFCLLQQSNQH